MRRHVIRYLKDYNLHTIDNKVAKVLFMEENSKYVFGEDENRKSTMIS